MIKKLLFGLIFISIMAGGAIYLFSDKTTETEDKTPVQVRAISQEFSLSPVNSYDNDAIWYGLSNGRLMRYDITQQTVTEYPTRTATESTYSSILWPRVGKDFIWVSETTNGKRFFHYSAENNKITPLPNNVLALDWLADGKRIVIIWKTADNKTLLVVSNGDGSGYSIKRELPASDFIPYASPKTDEALLIRAFPSDLINKIYLFDLDNGEYTEVVKDGLNTGVVWSPIGDRFAYTETQGNTTRLYVYDLLNDSSKFLELNTNINNVSFSANGLLLYAAAINKDTDKSEIHQVDLTNNNRTVILTLENTIRPKNLLVVGEKIYFINGIDNKLYGYD